MGTIGDIGQKIQGKFEEIEGAVEQQQGGVRGIKGGMKKMKGKIRQKIADTKMTAREEAARDDYDDTL
jgi:uncharacterized protein YjbJ (UPF0337 family)